MTSPYHNILIAGATNPTLGLKAAHSFLERNEFRVFILHTAHTDKDEKKKKAIQDLTSKGAVVVHAEYDNPKSLEKAMQGIDVVFSMLAGSVVVTGQLALLEAATKAGVKRFFTSDYGMDLSQVKKGDAEYYDPKLEVQEAVSKANIEHTFVATGLFADFFYSQFSGFDYKNHRVYVYGPKDMKISTTYSGDVAKLLPDILLHPESKNNYVKIISHTTTLEDAIATFERVMNTKFERVPLSEEEITEKYRGTHGAEQAGHFCKLQYIHGKGEIRQPFNKVHPNLENIKTMSVEDMAKLLTQ